MMHWMTLGELKAYSVESSSLLKTARWIEDFAAKPNVNLGRAGVVCPFIPSSLRLKSLQIMEVRALEMSQVELEALIKDCRETFLQQFPQQGKLSMYKALILVFPDISDDQCDYVDRVQQKLKPFFVEKRLMLGEFYPGNQSPGLHNSDFRPLQSPVPMLVVRSMTEADLPFLSRTVDAPEVRVKFLESYLKQMSILGHSSRLTEAYQALSESHQALDHKKNSAGPVSMCPFKRLERVIRRILFLDKSLFETPNRRLNQFLSKALPKLAGLIH